MTNRREFLRTTAVSSIGLPLVAHKSRASRTVFTDSFEDDSPGASPSGWSHFANADQKVVDGTASHASHSFRMAGSYGGCWEATAYHPCPIPNEGRVTFGGAVKPTTEGEIGCHSHRGHLSIASGAGGIYPDNKHTLLKFGTESNVVGVAGHDVGTYELNAWNTYRIRYRRDGDTVTVSYQLNGEDRGQTTYSAASWEDDLSHLHLRSGDVAVYWDDFAVTAGDAGARPTSSRQTTTTPSATDLRSITYGETKTGEIDGSDPTGYRGRYEPVTFDGTAGDVVTITLTTTDDPYLVLLAPDGTRVASNDDHGSLRDLNARIEEYELRSSGEYTIVATSYDSRATFEYELALERVSRADEQTTTDSEEETTTDSETGEYLSGTIVDLRDEPVEGARVEAYFRAAGGDGSDRDTALDSGAQLVAAATTDSGGRFEFDGSAGGTALPREEAESIRERFAAGYDKGVTLVAREPIPSGTAMTTGNVWFTGASLSSGEFFTSDFDVSLTLDCQRLFRGTLGDDDGTPNSRVLVFREVDIESPRRQTLNIEIRGAGPVGVITGGNCAIQVPEDIDVRYDDPSYGVYGTSLSESAYPFSVRDLAETGLFQQVAVSSAVRAVGFREYTPSTGEGEELQEETIRGIVGLLPVVGTIQGFVDTMSKVLDVNEGTNPIETVGQSSTYTPNDHDLAKGSWRTDDYAVNFRVPVTLSGTGRKEIAARGVWHAAVQGVFGGSETSALDHSFELATTLSESTLPGQS